MSAFSTLTAPGVVLLLTLTDWLVTFSTSSGSPGSAVDDAAVVLQHGEAPDERVRVELRRGDELRLDALEAEVEHPRLELRWCPRRRAACELETHVC
jgi:hypothetical protein